jgi:hypothetical protein
VKDHGSRYDFRNDRRHLLEQVNEMWSGADACYFDARKEFGCFAEIHCASLHIVDFFAAWWRVHEHWDGVTDPIRDAAELERQKT